MRKTSGEALGRKCSPGPCLSQTGGAVRGWYLSTTHVCLRTHTYTISSDTQHKFHVIPSLRPKCLFSVPIRPFRRAYVLLQSLLIITSQRAVPTPLCFQDMAGCRRGIRSICGAGLHMVSILSAWPVASLMGPAQCEL